jgi:hypothetical protein
MLLRLRLFRAISALTMLVAVSGSLVAVAAGASRPKVIASYCSPSGDVCLGVFKRANVIYLDISTAARYFARYDLCVRLKGVGGAAGLRRCGSFPVFRRSGFVWGSSVNYARQFPVADPGTYCVTWKLGTRPLGPTLSFSLPLHG